MNAVRVREMAIGAFDVVDEHVGADETRKAQGQTDYVDEGMQLSRKERSPGSS